MKKTKIIAVICLSLFSMFAVAMLAGCENNDENKKYDVTIKIKNNYGSEWIFTPDINELTYEFEYTGEEMYFGVDSYNLPDHPDWGDKWFGLTGEGPNVFSSVRQYCPPGGVYASFDGPVKEIGLYHMCFMADSTSNLWNFRSVHFYVNVI